MAKTVEELREGIRGKQAVLVGEASKYLSKTVVGNLQREIESDLKRIAEIIANQVRLGDGTIAEEGQNVFGHYQLPMVDKEGVVVNFTLYARTVKGTKKAADGTGYVTFQSPSKKFERLNWYQATRFFINKDEATAEIVTALETQRRQAEFVLATVDDILGFVGNNEPKVVDLADSEEEVQV